MDLVFIKVFKKLLTFFSFGFIIVKNICRRAKASRINEAFRESTVGVSWQWNLCEWVREIAW